MPWKKASPELSRLLEEALSAYPVAKKMMFGCPAYFVNGNMCAGVFQEDIFIRLSRTDQEQLIASCDEASPFEPMAGRPMKEYMILPETLYSDAAQLQSWLKSSYQYTVNLPVKAKKTKEQKSR